MIRIIRFICQRYGKKNNGHKNHHGQQDTHQKCRETSAAMQVPYERCIQWRQQRAQDKCSKDRNKKGLQDAKAEVENNGETRQQNPVPGFFQSHAQIMKIGERVV